MENLNNILKSKDDVIEQLLNEIALVKNDKDDSQNELLFKKQQIEILEMDMASREMEHQRYWDES